MKRGALCALLLGCTWLCACTQDEPKGAGHNLILICADTLRSDHLGLGGYELATSPNLDALAEGGASFERSFSTYPQTAASVASIFTSLYPSGHKVSEDQMQLSPGLRLLAETLQAAGYRTKAVATNPHLTPGLGFERGFESYTYIHGRNQARSSYEVPEGQLAPGIEFRQSKGSYYGRGDDVNQVALDWLDSLEGEQPFYLYLHYMDVHSPYISPEPYQDRFVEGEGRNVYRNGLPKGTPTPQNIAFTRARYDGGVAYLDHTIGELQRALAQRGLLERSFLIFTSDHGDEFMEHGGFGHGQTLYREQTQVPLIVSGPNVAPAVHRTPVSGVDLFPTILGLLGLAQPEGLQGYDLAPQLRGEESGTPPLRSLSEAHAARGSGTELEPCLAIYDERWHLIQRPTPGESELYDYLSDPAEAHNLLGEHPDVAARLAERARELQGEAERLGAHIAGAKAELSEATQAELDALGYGSSEDEEDDED